MTNIQYHLQFDKLCSTLRLGEMDGPPEVISGGLLHRMYAVKTTERKYAIKALNPQIMLRAQAMRRFIDSERIANIASDNINALPAKQFNGVSVQQIESQFYLVYDWVNGKSLKPCEINTYHCRTIGTALAEIRSMDFSELNLVPGQYDHKGPVDWCYYLQRGQESNAIWADQMKGILENLYQWNDQANEAAAFLASDMVISHRDLDPKNVMWNQDSPIIIDWESSGWVNPMHDLIETAVYWSENETGNIDKERFMALIGGYKDKYGSLTADWRIVLENGFSGKLGWLEYSLKRSLMVECTDVKEQKLGTEQVLKTLDAIKRYADMIPQMEEWLENMQQI